MSCLATIIDTQRQMIVIEDWVKMRSRSGCRRFKVKCLGARLGGGGALTVNRSLVRMILEG